MDLRDHGPEGRRDAPKPDGGIFRGPPRSSVARHPVDPSEDIGARELHQVVLAVMPQNLKAHVRNQEFIRSGDPRCGALEMRFEMVEPDLLGGDEWMLPDPQLFFPRDAPDDLSRQRQGEKPKTAMAELTANELHAEEKQVERVPSQAWVVVSQPVPGLSEYQVHYEFAGKTAPHSLIERLLDTAKQDRFGSLPPEDGPRPDGLHRPRRASAVEIMRAASRGWGESGAEEGRPYSHAREILDRAAADYIGERTGVSLQPGERPVMREIAETKPGELRVELVLPASAANGWQSALAEVFFRYLLLDRRLVFVEQK